ncbi:hypothetical protein JOC85_001808 [Bacillus mesophilus]|uniref:DUF3021 domain-containing protein n=1 Tax=Bacillus mesophilus TaxID=1808955 RepID=A0A6M0Q4W0_9BACI|nr:hypothetical protein [Bacillus mesophilus]MBM7661036.1 hypothetical protein [Bacillus mesophilus]NEY71426.1 hypothetical protein [Bacillus mesophilus]
MIKRKVLTTLLATPLSLLVICGVLFGEWERPFELIVMTGMLGLWISPLILLYGVPVTFLSDYVTKGLAGTARMLTACIVHLSFGILFGFVFRSDEQFLIFGIEVNVIIISASITALFFWVIDELFRSQKGHKYKFYSMR